MNQSHQQPPIINIMEKAARKAGKNLVRDFGELEKLQVSSKSLGDFVTNSDINSEKIIRETLSYYFPEYGFIMEESENIAGINKEENFIIDPIDGTSNFIHGIPQFSIVIAKMTNDQITDGIIFNPITNEFYWSSKGKGAWLNNQRLRVSNRKKLDQCLIGTGSPVIGKNDKEFSDQLKNIMNKSANIRRMGAAALDLAFVASGKLDAFWENNLNLWDIASGVLLVIEAGGNISEPNGIKWQKDSRNILASNALVHKDMINCLKL
tara:strand:- start:3348 stop:4142 length:795 start_codon:yes stop_codon:yes gene_type:complete